MLEGPSGTSVQGQTSILHLSLPNGDQLEGIEVAHVWGQPQDGQALTGWRFARIRPEARRVLQDEIGLPPVRGSSQDHDTWDEDEIELWDYVKVLIRRRWLIVACTFLAPLLAYVFAAMEPDMYTAEAQVFPVGEVDYLSLSEGVATGKTVPFIPVLESVPLNRQILRKSFTIIFPDSNTVTHDLVEWSVARRAEWDLDEAEEILAAPLGPGLRRRLEVGALGWLRGMTEFKAAKDGILTISVQAEFPDLAAQIANSYVDELEAYQLQTSTAHTNKNLVTARARMDTLQRELGVAERALEVFKKANQNLLKNMTDINLLMPEVSTRLDSLQRELDLKKRLFTTVAEQHELMRLQLSKDATGIEVVNRAEPPLSPETATRKLVLIGVVLGAFLGIFLAFIAEYLETKRKSGDLAPITEAWHQDLARLRRLLRM